MESNTKQFRMNKSKRNLMDSLVLLLKDNNIEDISVVSLVNNAKVCRKTFYLHYKNVKEIYNDIKYYFINSLINTINSTELNKYTIELFITNIFNTIKSNSNVITLLSYENYNRNVTNTICQVLISNISKKLNIQENNIEKRLVIEYNVYGCVEVFNKYLLNNNDTSIIKYLKSFIEKSMNE